MSGFFWAPERHDYKLLVSYSLLLPALLSTFNIYAWKTIAGKPIFWLALTYLAYMTMVGLFRQNENASEYIKWSWYVVLFLFAIGLRMRITDYRLSQVLLLSAVIAAAAIIYAAARDLISGAILNENYRLIGYGALYNPLRSSHLFGAFACIAAWYATNNGQHSYRRALAWLATTVCFAGILLTGSRSPLFSIFALCLMIALFDLYRRKNPATLAALAGLSLAICFPLWSTLSERGLSLRPEIWGHVWGLVPQNPLFGVGLNEPLRIKVAEAVFLDTHNIVLAVLYRGGMIGVALFLIMYGYSLYRIWSTSSESRLHTLSAILMLYGLLTLQFDGGSLLGRPTEFWVLLWFPLALSLRVGRSDNERPIFDKFHAVKN